jgi:thioredoxin-dependent peroxiredoxin
MALVSIYNGPSPPAEMLREELLRHTASAACAARPRPLGLSRMSATWRSQVLVAAKLELPSRSLADTDNTVSTAYGVWKEKSMYGRSYMGIDRATFLIDEKGKIARIWPS